MELHALGVPLLKILNLLSNTKLNAYLFPNLTLVLVILQPCPME